MKIEFAAFESLSQGSDSTLPLRLFKTVYDSGYMWLSVVLLKMWRSSKQFGGKDVMEKVRREIGVYMYELQQCKTWKREEKSNETKVSKEFPKNCSSQNPASLDVFKSLVVGTTHYPPFLGTLWLGPICCCNCFTLGIMQWPRITPFLEDLYKSLEQSSVFVSTHAGQDSRACTQKFVEGMHL